MYELTCATQSATSIEASYCAAVADSIHCCCEVVAWSNRSGSTLSLMEYKQRYHRCHEQNYHQDAIRVRAAVDHREYGVQYRRAGPIEADTRTCRFLRLLLRVRDGERTVEAGS